MGAIVVEVVVLDAISNFKVDEDSGTHQGLVVLEGGAFVVDKVSATHQGLVVLGGDAVVDETSGIHQGLVVLGRVIVVDDDIVTNSELEGGDAVVDGVSGTHQGLVVVELSGTHQGLEVLEGDAVVEMVSGTHKGLDWVGVYCLGICFDCVGCSHFSNSRTSVPLVGPHDTRTPPAFCHID